MNNVIRDFFVSNYENFLEVLKFTILVLLGVTVRMIKANEMPTIKRILSEIIMAFFVAILVYAVLDQFFELHKLFVYASCSYAGSISSRFLDKIEDTVSAILKLIPEWFRSKIK